MALKQRIALDSMIFIYHFEQTEAYFGRVQEIFLSAKIGVSELITSVISVTETLAAPKYASLPEIAREIDLFFREADFLKVIGFDWEIAHEAAKLRRENKSLRVPDAIQLATAIVGGADIFVTNDVRLRGLRLGSLKIKILGSK